MKKLLLALCLALLSFTAFSINITIINSRTYAPGHVMDTFWYMVAYNMGHNPKIVHKTTLDNTAFFANTDLLIVASGVDALTPLRVNNIMQFIKTGKPVYLQTEYDTNFTTNKAFRSMLKSLGGTFSWGTYSSGYLNGVLPVGTFANTYNPVISENLYNPLSGTGDCNTANILQYSGQYYGFQYIPANTLYGSLSTTTCQDWIRINASPEVFKLMGNIITHLINPSITGIGTHFTLGNDTTVCPGTTLQLDVTIPTATYLWQDLSTNPTYTATHSGTYWVRVTVNGCAGMDTLHIYDFALPVVELGNDTILCAGSSITLDATNSGATYLWQDSSANAAYNVTMQGTFWVYVSTHGCAGVSDTINVYYYAPVGADIGSDTAICPGNSLLLDATTLNATYLWQDNSTGATFTATLPGTYWVDVNVYGCTARDSVIVSYATPPAVSLGGDTLICAGDLITLDAGPGFTQYSWNTGGSTQAIALDSTGLGMGPHIITVTVTDLHSCQASDSIVVTFDPCAFIGETAQSGFTLWPNPADRSLNIASDDRETILTCELYDAAGNLLPLPQTVTEAGNIIIPTAGLSNGLYLIALTTGKGRLARQFIVQH